MAVAQTTPLILFSDIKNRINAKPTATDVNSRVLDTIIGASALLTSDVLFGRRFDERVETIPFGAAPLAAGGDVDGRDLLLSDSLKAVTTLTNGDSAPISASDYILLPGRRDRHGVLVYDTIHLKNTSAVSWTSGSNDWVNAISVAGLWGYGGQWVSVGTIGAGNGIDASTTSLTLAGLEAGMVLKIDSEYLYVETAATPNTVSRAHNGSSSAAHAEGAAVYRFQACDLVRQLAARLALWGLEQDKNPFFGQAVVGDIVVPYSTEGLPKDVVSRVNLSGLKRVEMPSGV